MSDASRDDLIEETRESYETAREEQEAALEQIASGGAFGRTESISLGGLEIDVNKWISEDDLERINTFQSLPANEDDLRQEHVNTLLEKHDEVIGLLSNLSVDETYDESFWSLFYEDYGPIGAYLALMTMIEPVLRNMEEQGEQLGNLRERIEDEGSG